MVTDGRCRAYKGTGGGRVFAVATCHSISEPGTDIQVLESQQSQPDAGAFADVACPSSEYLLLGCSCHNFWQRCSGAKVLVAPDGRDTCRVYSGGGGAGGSTGTSTSSTVFEFWHQGSKPKIFREQIYCKCVMKRCIVCV